MADEKYILLHSGAQIDAAIDQAEANRVAIAGKADAGHTHTRSQITDFAHTHSDKVDKVDGMGLVDENFASRIQVMTAEPGGSPYTYMKFDGEIIDQYDNRLSNKQNIISNLYEIQEHLVNTDIHADENEKEEWNAAYTHSTNTSAHVSSTDRSNWNGKADADHNHDSAYATKRHTHTASEVGAASTNHNHDTAYAAIDHNHDTVYAGINHTHDYEVNIGFNPNDVMSMKHDGVTITYTDIRAAKDAGQRIFIKVGDAFNSVNYEGHAVYAGFDFNLCCAYMSSGTIHHAWVNVTKNNVVTHGVV